MQYGFEGIPRLIAESGGDRDSEILSSLLTFVGSIYLLEWMNYRQPSLAPETAVTARVTVPFVGVGRRWTALYGVSK